MRLTELLERRTATAVYDEPEFIVRNIWRLYGGWYDGNVSRGSSQRLMT